MGGLLSEKFLDTNLNIPFAGPPLNTPSLQKYKRVRFYFHKTCLLLWERLTDVINGQEQKLFTILRFGMLITSLRENHS